jgi:hypothetical protein
MSKLRRKHPGFNTMEETAQGLYFLRHVYNLVGEGVRYFPLERLDDKADVWRIEGRRAWGLLVERTEGSDGDMWNLRWGFRLMEPVGDNLIVQATLSPQRWDPWLAFGQGKDSPVPTATRQQRKEWDRAESKAASSVTVSS